MSKDKRGFLEDKKGLMAVLATGVVLAGSFAFFTDNKTDEFRGGMKTLGIETTLTGQEQLEGNEGLLVPGDSVTLNLKTDVNADEGRGSDAKIRHRVSLDTENLELLKEGRLTLSIDGKEMDADSEELVTDIVTVKAGESTDYDIKLTVADATLNGATLADFSADIITEALQEDNTDGTEFDNYEIIGSESISFGEGTTETVAPRQ